MGWRVLLFALAVATARGEVDVATERRALRDAPLASTQAPARGEAFALVLGELSSRASRLTPEFRWLVENANAYRSSFATPDEERLIALAVAHSVALELAADARRNIPLAPVVPQRTLIHQATALTRPTSDDNRWARRVVCAAATMIQLAPPFAAPSVLQDGPHADTDRDLRVLFERIAGRAPAGPEAPHPAPAPVSALFAALAVLSVACGVAVRAWRSPPPPRPKPEPSPLDRLAQHLPARYTRPRRIGQGATGVVFEVEDTVLSRPVAIKLIAPELRTDDAACQRFVKEARQLAALSHPGVLTVYDVQSEPWPYIAMELLEGTSLARRLAQGPVKDDHFYRIALALLAALEHVHRAGFVHGALHPEMIFVRADGTALITEFGRAGKPPYLAPEQLEGGPTDGRCDLFALGVVMREMLGELSGDRAPLAPVIERVLAAHPNDRYFSARDVATDLRAARAKARGTP